MYFQVASKEETKDGFMSLDFHNQIVTWDADKQALVWTTVERLEDKISEPIASLEEDNDLNGWMHFDNINDAIKYAKTGRLPEE